MNKFLTFFRVMILIGFVNSAYAGFPTPYTQTTPYTQNSGQFGSQSSNPAYQQYMQGQGNGSSYYNPNTYQTNQSLQYQQYLSNAQQMQGATSTSSDLLWLFTGSQGTLSDQMHSGFRSSGTTSFWGRLWGVLGNAVYRRVGPKIDNILGGIENKANTIGQSGINGMYNQTGASGYCAQCALQNSTNPYYRSQQAINPSLFNGGTTTNPTLTSGSSAGGINRGP